MPAVLSKRTADWLRSAMARDSARGFRPRRIAYAGGGGGGGGDGCKIGIIQTGATGDSTNFGSEVDSHIMTAYVYPAWPEQTGRYLVRVYTPCVYRRSPLMPGDPVLLHPCAVGVTTEGEDT